MEEAELEMLGKFTSHAQVLEWQFTEANKSEWGKVGKMLESIQLTEAGAEIIGIRICSS